MKNIFKFILLTTICSTTIANGMKYNSRVTVDLSNICVDEKMLVEYLKPNHGPIKKFNLGENIITDDLLKYFLENRLYKINSKEIDEHITKKKILAGKDDNNVMNLKDYKKCNINRFINKLKN